MPDDDESPDWFKELCGLIEDSGAQVRFDRKCDITLCAVCGRRSNSPDRPPSPRDYRTWTIKLPWLGFCRMACSEECEQKAIAARDQAESAKLPG